MYHAAMIRGGGDADRRHANNTSLRRPMSVRRFMHKFSLLTVAALLLSPLCSLAQAKVFLTREHAVSLPTASNQQVVMAAVSLGKTDKPLTITKIVAVGTMTPDPHLEAVSYELLFLVCDQPDCQGAVKSPVVLWQDDWQTPLCLLATKSFGVEERHVESQVLAERGMHSDVGDLYVAMAIKLLHGSPIVPGTATNRAASS
jgi:hypothetical protein